MREEGTHRCFMTTCGWRVALFFTRIDARVLGPTWAVLGPDDRIPAR